jgi:hypothetical protein
MSGGATLGSDYTLSGPANHVVIPAGQSSATVTFNAIADHVKEKTQRGIMNLAAGTGYAVAGTHNSATIAIVGQQ